MKRAIILEDEPKAEKLLRSLLSEHCPSIVIVGASDRIAGSLDLIEQCAPDVVFSDIQLQDGTSFDLFAQMEKIDFDIIFTTAYEQYAIKAFDLNAIHYILKPYSKETIIAAVQRLESYGKPNESKNLIDIVNLLRKNNGNQRIGLPTSTGIEMIDVKEIIRIEADRAYCMVYYGSQKLFVGKSLNTVESLLPNSIFIRVHASHLVNLSHIQRYIKADGGSLGMSDGFIVPVSRRNKKEVLAYLKR